MYIMPLQTTLMGKNWSYLLPFFQTTMALYMMGGRNTVLLDALSWRIPLVSDIPTIIFGAEVTHPESGEDSIPSIAAVVASQDWPEVTKYAGLVRAHSLIGKNLFKICSKPGKILNGEQLLEA